MAKKKTKRGPGRPPLNDGAVPFANRADGKILRRFLRAVNKKKISKRQAFEEAMKLWTKLNS